MGDLDSEKERKRSERRDASFWSDRETQDARAALGEH
jgi:hypothetical protein